MIWELAALFACAAVAPLAHALLRGRSAFLLPWILALVPAVLTASYLGFAPEAAEGSVREASYPWIPSMGLSLDFALDSFSCLFAILICGIGSCVVIYAGSYLKGDPRLGRFYLALFLFMASMLGVVMSDHLILLFVFWELTGIASYLLIGFEHENPDARKSALQALLVTGFGGLAMLAGFLLLGQGAETYKISEILQRVAQVQGDYFLNGIVVLILMGVFTKSAQFPFHFWLPNAMAAPTPVSAYLHSATMVKAGIYLAARLNPAFVGVELWEGALLLFGGFTLVTACWQALSERELKRILAYTTLGALSMLFMFLGAGLIESFVAFLLAHALYKAAFFLLAGSVDHGAGTRDVYSLGNLKKSMPITAAAAALAGLAMATLPPTLGFLGKEAALVEFAAETSWLSLIVLCLGSAVFTSMALVLALRVFWLRPLQAKQAPNAHEVSFMLWGAPVLLGFLGVGAGLAHTFVAERFLDGAASDIAGRLIEIDFHFWHGFSPALLLSLSSWVFGITLFTLWPRLQPVLQRLQERLTGPEDFFLFFVKELPGAASRFFSLFQSGSLPRYVAWTLSFAAFGLLLPFMRGTQVSGGSLNLGDVHLYEYLLCVALLLGALYTVTAAGALRALVSLGVVGFSVACAYVFYGAPDLALTQILVESISLLLVLLVFARLPRVYVRVSASRTALSALLASTLGFALGLVLWIGAKNPLFESISPFFNENSLSKGNGRNVVNVILVDFRGWDTMGEISVLAIAALGVFAMLRFTQDPKSEKKAPL
jgi:multicomponent Na+:H+ antiporter subunit A